MKSKCSNCNTIFISKYYVKFKLIKVDICPNCKLSQKNLNKIR